MARLSIMRQLCISTIQLCMHVAAAGRSRQLTTGVRCVATISRPTLSPMPDIANIRRSAVRSPPPYNVLITGSTKGVALILSWVLSVMGAVAGIHAQGWPFRLPVRVPCRV